MNFLISGTLQGIFSQIIQGDDTIRERAIGFVANKLRVLLNEGVITKDVEDELIAHCKKVKFCHV
jgi:Apoptosis inhibitory protein 5 (API5)